MKFPFFLIATPALLFLPACGTPSAAEKASAAETADNDFLKDGNTPNAVAERMFGLDYTTDEETGQSRGSRTFEMGDREFSGNNSTFSKQAQGRDKAFDTDKFAGGRSAETDKRFGSKQFTTTTSRYGDTESRYGNRQARNADGAYRDASKAVPADPYRESSKMMRAGDYRPSVVAQEKNDRAINYPQRVQQPGDPAVNYRSDELTVDDVKGLLNKGGGGNGIDN